MPIKARSGVRASIALGVLSGSFFVAVARPATPPDLILYNGKVFTSSYDQPWVQALAIRGQRILAIGESAQILALRGPSTQTFDLGGRAVIPGINDAHVHLGISPLSGPKPLTELPLKDLNPTRVELIAAIAEEVRKTPAGTMLTAYIGSAVYFDPQITLSLLDSAAPNNPVMLTTFTGHAAFLNSAALKRFGLHDGQPNPAGGKYERGPDGKLNGLVREYALLDLERQLADATSDADALQELQALFAEAVQFGITSIQDMSNSMTPERAVTLLEKVPVKVRVRVMRMPMTTTAGRSIQEGRPAPHPTSSLITVSGTKWLLDGTPIEGTFASRESRAAEFASAEQSMRKSGAPLDMTFSGFGMLFPESELVAILRETRGDDDPLLLHVTGYPATSTMLKALQANGGSNVWATRRVRFEHGDSLFPDLIPSAKELQIVVVENPTHLALGDMIPGLMLEKAQPLRSLLNAGIPLALGSDGPLNPYLNIMLASTDPNRPGEAITREQAVIAYTRTSAYAEFSEKDKGSLEPGKLADLAVLSQDIFTVPLPQLPGTKSVLTIVDGQVVYDAKVVSAR